MQNLLICSSSILVFLVCVLLQPDRAYAALSAETSRSSRSTRRSETRLRVGTHARDVASLAPKQFLIMTSPMEQKIVYVQIKNLKAVSPHPVPRVSPLIDAGLTTPMGVAVDRTHGFVYVADLDAGSIYRYKLFVKGDTLFSDGVQLPVITGRQVRWLAVDQHGNVYFSDQAANAVYKLDFATIQEMAMGTFTAGDLKTVREKEAEEEAEIAATEAVASDGSALPQLPPPPPKPVIHTLYEASANPHVSKPSGIATNSEVIFWGNEYGGLDKGTVVEGEVTPKAPATSGATEGGAGAETEGAPTFTTNMMAQNVGQAFGVALTSDAVLYTDVAQYVYGVRFSGGTPATFTDKLQQPRGIVFDGDSTAYVADRGGHAIFSFPCGRLQGTSITRIIDFHDVFGLAILSETDPAWTATHAAKAYAIPFARLGRMVASLVAVLALLR